MDKEKEEEDEDEDHVLDSAGRAPCSVQLGSTMDTCSHVAAYSVLFSGVLLVVAMGSYSDSCGSRSRCYDRCVVLWYKIVVAPPLQFFDGRHPCRAAEAHRHGPVCSEDHSDSACFFF